MLLFSLLYGQAQAAGTPVAPSVAAFGLLLLLGSRLMARRWTLANYWLSLTIQP